MLRRLSQGLFLALLAGALSAGLCEKAFSQQASNNSAENGDAYQILVAASVIGNSSGSTYIDFPSEANLLNSTVVVELPDGFLKILPKTYTQIAGGPAGVSRLSIYDYYPVGSHLVVIFTEPRYISPKELGSRAVSTLFGVYELQYGKNLKIDNNYLKSDTVSQLFLSSQVQNRRLVDVWKLSSDLFFLKPVKSIQLDAAMTGAAVSVTDVRMASSSPGYVWTDGAISKVSQGISDSTLTTDNAAFVGRVAASYSPANASDDQLITEFMKKFAPSSDGMMLPWPPPRPSAEYVFTRDEIMGGDPSAPRTVGDVRDALVRRVRDAGFDDERFYLAPHGFGMALSVERFDGRGVSLDGLDRWVVGLGKPDIRDPMGLAKALIGMRVGHFRCILLVVTDGLEGFAVDNQVSLEQARALSALGPPGLPDSVATLPFGDHHGIYAFIYDFDMVDGVKETGLVFHSPFPGKVQLIGAGIMKGELK